MWILRNHDLMQTQENLCFLLRIKNAVYFYFMCIGILPAYMSVRESDPLKQELQAVVSCHVGAGN